MKLEDTAALSHPALVAGPLLTLAGLTWDNSSIGGPSAQLPCPGTLAPSGVHPAAAASCGDPLWPALDCASPGPALDCAPPGPALDCAPPGPALDCALPGPPLDVAPPGPPWMSPLLVLQIPTASLVLRSSNN
ncbi:hypothetical protein NHX12_011936 [Muraenolepis orangiensis]|uniref:Uncharacterized protein n=1 Tax=Muraenolepis orangiensis TaxID=630683 RepID=A0A9Q0I861_9TELE|nr:hypothetical protein NHX12_011936 [Muraenolepis orangiensis]